MNKAIETLKTARSVLSSARNGTPGTYAEGFAAAAINQAIELLEAELNPINVEVSLHIAHGADEEEAYKAMKRRKAVIETMGLR